MIVDPEKSKICRQCLKHGNNTIFFMDDVEKLYRLARLHKNNKYFSNCCYYVNQDFKEYLSLKNDEWPYSNEIRFIILEYQYTGMLRNTFKYVVAGYGCKLYNTDHCPYYLEHLLKSHTEPHTSPPQPPNHKTIPNHPKPKILPQKSIYKPFSKGIL